MTAMTTAVSTEHSTSPPRYRKGENPFENTTSSSKPASAAAPTPSSTERSRFVRRTPLLAPSRCDGHTNASHAPMSSENARVSVP